MATANPGFERLKKDNCPVEFPDAVKKVNHTHDEWFKKRVAAEKSEAFVRHFSDTITLDPGANNFHMGITPSHIILFSPRLSDEIKA
jgi:hypothetical protein